MRAYTDVEQSKKLAQILPMDSADMVYIQYSEGDGNWRFDDKMPPMILADTPISMIYTEKLPCWSIGALLDVLPAYITKDGHDYWLEFEKFCNEKGDWNGYTVGYYDVEKREFDANLMFFENANFIDCLYDMVLWYNKNKSELCG